MNGGFGMVAFLVVGPFFVGQAQSTTELALILGHVQTLRECL